VKLFRLKFMNFKRSPLIFLAGIILLITLAGGCGVKSIEEIPAEDLAKKGLQYYNYGKYFKALETFRVIKERFPFSRFSLLAELKAADCHYYLGEYPEALVLYKEFEERHPTNEAIPYVLFQIGRCHYKSIDTVDRDPGGAQSAIKIFGRLIRTFPQSSYVTEAHVLVRKSKNFLAEHELYVANFYFRTEEFEQAKGRAEFLIANYPDTPAAKKATDLLTRSGEAIGKTEKTED